MKKQTLEIANRYVQEMEYLQKQIDKGLEIIQEIRKTDQLANRKLWDCIEPLREFLDEKSLKLMKMESEFEKL